MLPKCSRAPQTATQSVPARLYSSRERARNTSSEIAIGSAASSNTSGFTLPKTIAMKLPFATLRLAQKSRVSIHCTHCVSRTFTGNVTGKSLQEQGGFRSEERRVGKEYR